RGVIWIPEKSDARNGRNDLFEKLQPFGGNLRPEDGIAGDICPGARETCDEPRAHGIADREHDDGNRRRRLLGRGGRGSTRGPDAIDRQARQFACGHGEPIGFALRRTVFKGDGLAFDIAEVAQPLPERVPYRCVVDNADPWNLGWALLRARRERPSGRAGEQRYDCAASEYL